MEKRFCKDCPCLEIVEYEDDYPDAYCRLDPTRVEIGDTQHHYCYRGRKIMAEEEAIRKAKESYEVKSDEQS